MKHLKPCEPLDAFFQVQPFSAAHISLQFLLLVAPLEFLKVPTHILTSLRLVSGPTNVINAFVNAFHILSRAFVDQSCWLGLSMCILLGQGISQKTGSKPLHSCGPCLFRGLYFPRVIKP